MAPECLYGKPYAEKADVFSYGIILAEIMARIPADPEYMPRTNVSTHTHTRMHTHCSIVFCKLCVFIIKMCAYEMPHVLAFMRCLNM